MTVGERIDFVKSLLTNEDEMIVNDTVISTQLICAKDAIMNRLYPQTPYPEKADVPVRWQVIQCKLAVRYISRMGIEGEDKHSENGIVREYTSADDYDLLSIIPPYARLY